MNAVGEIGHHLHVVLDPDHGGAELVLDAQDEARQVLPFVAVEPGGRLVEHEQRGLERQRAREADDLLDAERKSRDGRVPIALELDEFDDALDRLAVTDLLAPDAGKEQHLGQRIGADAGVAAGQEVVEHRHLREQLAVLEGAREAEPRDLVRLAAGNVRAAEVDFSLAPIDAAHAVEHAGLAGAVRPDQREQLAGVDRERHAVEHREAAETKRQAVDLELSHTTSGCGDIA